MYGVEAELSEEEPCMRLANRAPQHASAPGGHGSCWRFESRQHDQERGLVVLM